MQPWCFFQTMKEEKCWEECSKCKECGKYACHENCLEDKICLKCRSKPKLYRCTNCKATCKVDNFLVSMLRCKGCTRFYCVDCKDDFTFSNLSTCIRCTTDPTLLQPSKSQLLQHLLQTTGLSLEAARCNYVNHVLSIKHATSTT